MIIPVSPAPFPINRNDKNVSIGLPIPDKALIKTVRFSGHQGEPQQPVTSFKQLLASGLSLLKLGLEKLMAKLPSLNQRLLLGLSRLKAGVEKLIVTLSPPIIQNGMEILYRTNYFRVCRTLTPIKNHYWTFVRPNRGTGSVLVVPVIEDNVVFIEQRRPPVDAGRKTMAPVIEFPGGLIGDITERQEESPEQAAEVELLEETGYTGERFTMLGDVMTSPGLMGLPGYIVKAEGLKKVADKMGTEGEEILAVHEVPIKEVHAWLEKKKSEGCVVSNYVYSGLYFLLKDGQKSPDPQST